MISFDEAIERIAAAARRLPAETVPLHEAAGRVLAEPVVAAIDSPRADVSAMDGYAARGTDLADLPVSLRVVGESFPGIGWPGTLERGSCVRVFTGAPLPDGADLVVIQERVTRDGEVVQLAADPGPATWVRRRGGDFAKGETIVPAGRPLDPAALIAAAGADASSVEVYRRPRAALLSTGDELVEPGDARNADLAVPDSVAFGIAALAAQWGGDVVRRARLRDHLDAMIEAARDALPVADVLVVSGGASVGDRDFAKAMFEPLGLELLFSKVAIRPGKPAWFGRVGDTLILGLPGNPTSALVTARLLLAPLLALLQGRPDRDALEWEPARVRTALSACDARETFHRAMLSNGEAAAVDFQESHGQRSLAQANVLIRQPAGSPAVAVGEIVALLRL
jgi:molybdopterin molybdotransferase